MVWSITDLPIKKETCSILLQIPVITILFLVIQIWPENEFPLIEAGKLVLNENPKNYFQQVEQMALCASHMIPGIEPSPDRVLQVINNVTVAVSFSLYARKYAICMNL